MGAAIALFALGSGAAHPAKSDRGDARPFTLLFVGGAAGDDSSPTLGRLRTRLEALDPERALVVFTGNYGQGELPAPGEPTRAREAGHVLAHVEAVRDFVARGGKVYFLAGHRDFPPGGTRAVRRLRSFLNRSLQADGGSDDDEGEDEDGEEKPALDVMPHAGCGDVTLLELTEHLGVLLLDSQWWMQDWANDPQANQGCDVKSRVVFAGQVRATLAAYRSRRLVVVTHHPLRSDGELGGSFTPQAHLSPAPLLGTFWVLARQAGLVEQYQNHPLVRSYLDLVLDEAQRQGSYVFASGHDASLQYLHVERQVQIVSGTSSSSPGATVKAGAGDFAAARAGWAEVVIEPSGAGEVTYLAGEADQVLFTAQLPEVLAAGPEPLGPPPPFPSGQVTSTFTKAEVWRMGSVMKALVGSFYSDAYAVQLRWDTLNLETEQGGLKVKGPGGGTQTNSLKLRDPQGAEWVARSVTKDSSRALPWPQNQATLLNRLLDHGYTASQPEAALSVARLSLALGLLHAEPRLLYLPDQERLGRYRGYLANEVVLLEQRPKVSKKAPAPEDLVGPTGTEGATHIRTTGELQARVIAHPWKHRVDQEEMLRARLLDLFIGDWDRHPGQWRFAELPGPDGTHLYRPIARDRDQAFANYDGLGLFLARIATSGPRTLQPFGAGYGSIRWLAYNARNLDPIVLNQIPRERWLAIAREVQAALTDQVLDEALATWRPETYALDGARVVAALRTRRDTLVTAADEYFALLARHVDVLGSSADDLFELWFQDQGAVRVTVRARGKAGQAGAPFFDRVFEPAQTSEVRLYALAGDDTLLVHGPAATPMVIRFVGGPGLDTVTAAPGAQAGPLDGSAIRLHDTPDGAVIDPSIRVRDERSAVPQLNEYDPDENHDPDVATFLPNLYANPDYGLFLGGRVTYLVQGFKKHPFAARHEFGAAFATATLGLVADYQGLFPQSLGLLDQQVALLVAPSTTRNFFGLTNSSLPPAAAGDFYRVKQGWYEARYGVIENFGGTWTRAGAQVLAQAVVTEATAGRSVSTAPDAASGLGPRYFAGARLFIETNTFDDPVLPTRGVALHASAEGRFDVVHGGAFSVTWKGAGAVAIPFDRERRVVLVTRASVEGIVGDHPFYFAPSLGDTNLRAYWLQQLAGDVAFVQTTDLRIDVLRVRSWLPGTLGVNLSLDHGRVWGTTSPSNEYHLNYGGGVWLSILDVIGVSLNYDRALTGGSRFVFALGPLFSRTGF
jgi:hypothetical protein